MKNFVKHVKINKKCLKNLKTIQNFSLKERFISKGAEVANST